MKSVKLDTKKDKNGKIKIIIKEVREISKSEVIAVAKRVKVATEMIDRISKVDLNILKKPFTI